MWSPRQECGGARGGVLLKSNAPYSSVWVEMAGLQCEKRSKFKVSSTCGRNSSQSWRGHSMSTVARAAIKCSLKVAMVHSVVLTG